MRNIYKSKYNQKKSRRKKNKNNSKRKSKKGGENSPQNSIFGNVKETVRIIGVGTTSAVKNAVEETLKITDKSLEVTGNTIRDSLDTIGATEKAINSSLQETVGLVAETTKSAANISKEALKTSESVASTGLNVVDVTTTNAANVTNEATTQSAKVANTALKHAGELTSTTISTTSNALFALLGTVSNTVEDKTDKIRAQQESIAEYYSAKQLNELNNEAKRIFSDRIKILKNNLDDYVKSQRGFIELSLVAFKMNKCTPGRIYGHTCGINEQQVITDFKNKLKVIDQNANANKRLLEGLSTQAGTALLTIYGEDIDPPKYKNEANKKLAPFYAEASKIFERTLVDYQKLNEELDDRLKENLKEIKEEAVKDESVKDDSIKEELQYPLEGGKRTRRQHKTKRLKKNRNTNSKKKKRVKNK